MRNKTNFKRLMVIGLIALFPVINSYSQEKNNKCRVLLSSISESYDGDCKKGFAHGKGTAYGIDKYEGKFKNGLPHGQGVYTWKNGNVYDGNWKNGKRNGVGVLYSASNGEKVKGQWKDDEFIKEIVDPPYKITYNSGLTRISFTDEQKNLDRVQIILMRNGVAHETFESLDITGNSGSKIMNGNFIGFENVTFPFEGTIRFRAPNQLNTNVNEYILRFEINKEGTWKVIANY